MKITIKNREIELKQTMRSMIIWEKIQDKAFNITNLSDVLIYLYSTIQASDRNSDITIDEFFDWIDANPQAFVEFQEWLENEAKRTQQASQKNTKKKKTKK